MDIYVTLFKIDFYSYIFFKKLKWEKEKHLVEIFIFEACPVYIGTVKHLAGEYGAD